MTQTIGISHATTDAELRAILQPGDVLLYTPAGLFGKLITMKTWSDFSHSELYLGQGIIATVGGGYAWPDADVWASRDPKRWLPRPSGGGVNFWPLRTSQLAVVRRPKDPIALHVLLDFCQQTAGQSYDWWGLLRFFKIGRGKTDRQFCSEAITRALRLAGCELFDNCDADSVSPGMLAWTRDLGDVWRKA